MTIVRMLAAGSLALTLTAGTAVASDECTDTALNAKFEELGKYLEANPDKQDKVETAAKEVEKEYGGEPPREKQCEAVDSLLGLLKSS